MAEVKIEALLGAVERLIAAVETGGVKRLTVNFLEAGKMMGRSARTISRMEKRGEIQSVQVCGEKMIPVDELYRVATPKVTLARGRPPSRSGTGRASRASVEALLKRKR